MNWERELQRSATGIEHILPYLNVDRRVFKQLQHIVEIHPMRIPRYYLSLIDWDDPQDPLRRMAVPDVDELDLSGSYDTSGEADNTKMPGLQHKYPQTALILTTNRCSMYCRHCFRKRLVGLPTNEVMRRFGEAAKYIEEHPEITNVLLSGGDPLVLKTSLIEAFLARLSKIPSLEFIRIGSRVPVTFPDRILTDDDLVTTLRKYSRKVKQLYLVTQFNHPREITEKSTQAVSRLLDAGLVVLNQAILLKSVNDDPRVMADLQTRLTGIGVSPYYVFQCRPVRRVKRHFQVPLKAGCAIIDEAKKLLDGPSKRFRYVMSHRTGKIEIVGVMGNEIYLKYHQARDPNRVGKLFKRKLTPDAGWLDDLPHIPAVKVVHTRNLFWS
ncbi:MAG TPA: KamA family radical SAM protein, partial [Firmicutes bacterium]|nr:KamA family radical SAM protein [Bacillota bacterium]